MRPGQPPWLSARKGQMDEWACSPCLWGVEERGDRLHPPCCSHGLGLVQRDPGYQRGPWHALPKSSGAGDVPRQTD